MASKMVRVFEELFLKHLQHSPSDKEAAKDIDRGDGNGDEAEDRDQRKIFGRAEGDHGADYDYARDGVGHGH